MYELFTSFLLICYYLCRYSFIKCMVNDMNYNIILWIALTMTSPMCEDGGTLREWAPLAMLLQQIPAKIQTGLFTHNINFTCIDAVPEFIAIGTNYGLVYWFDREKQDLQRLRCEVSYIIYT